MSAVYDEEATISIIKPLKVSIDSSHHIVDDNTAAYGNRFDEVLPFHAIDDELQLAPVYLQGQAWHIKTNGEANYASRYERTFGFYCGLAAVVIAQKYFHIGIDGLPAYSQRYAFVGNYQGNVAVVCDHDGYYTHIDKQGLTLYEAKWHYCGDFREGIAVVQELNGYSSHIDLNGLFLHDKWFDDLDVFHKGFARAKDKSGWHHIDKAGKSIYSSRYASVEPFYNGCSRVETFAGSLLVIDESGDILRTLRSAQFDDFASLSADLVGYWRTFTIAAAVELSVFEHLPANVSELATMTQTLPERLIRLLRALAELQLVYFKNESWFATPKGSFLTQNHNMSLATASLEYQGELLQRWHQLAQIMKGEVAQNDIFQEVASDPVKVKSHHKMLRSYAIKDYSNLIPLLDIKNQDIVFDAAGGSGALVQMLELHYPDTRIVLGDLPEVIANSEVKEKIEFDLFNTWPLRVNKIILARVLHDWDDEHVFQILSHAAATLESNGELYILEMLLSETDFGGSLCDLHLLSVTGGQERTLQHYAQLANNAGLNLKQTMTEQGLVSVLCFTKKDINE
ncbi:MAG: methyltransferase [Methyloprofundus sp.]|nr:methyltransferase [Methyloprofundus sp.]